MYIPAPMSICPFFPIRSYDTHYSELSLLPSFFLSPPSLFVFNLIFFGNFYLSALQMYISFFLSACGIPLYGFIKVYLTGLLTNSLLIIDGLFRLFTCFLGWKQEGLG